MKYRSQGAGYKMACSWVVCDKPGGVHLTQSHSVFPIAAHVFHQFHQIIALMSLKGLIVEALVMDILKSSVWMKGFRTHTNLIQVVQFAEEIFVCFNDSSCVLQCV